MKVIISTILVLVGLTSYAQWSTFSANSLQHAATDATITGSVGIGTPANTAPAETPAPAEVPAEKEPLRADGSDALPTASTPQLRPNGEPIAFNVGAVAVP